MCRWYDLDEIELIRMEKRKKKKKKARFVGWRVLMNFFSIIVTLCNGKVAAKDSGK